VKTPNPSVNRTCAKSRACRLLQRWAPMNSRLALLTFCLITATVVAACSPPPQATFRFYLFADSAAPVQVLVDGAPISSLERHVPGWDVYAPSYLSYSKNGTMTISIMKGSTTLASRQVAPGSYVVNASQRHLVSAEELAYGRPVAGAARFLEPSPVGVYFLDSSTSLLVFDFDKTPPESIRSKRGSIKAREFFKLVATPT
jgi:hypothetical protein